MGLPVRMILHAADEDRARTAAAAAFARIAALDRIMSDYRPDSELRALEANPGEWNPVSAELLAVLRRAVEIARASSGAFDPTIGPLVGLWRDARQTHKKPDGAAIDVARRLTGFQHLTLDPWRRAIKLALPGMRLDLGGIAKGYILQDALRILRDHGVTRALVEAGGDIVVGDAPPGQRGWRIDTARADAAFRSRAGQLTHAALATSGATAQFVEIDGVRYSHVIDPRTGLGLTNRVVARVIAYDAMTADALATALTVLGPQGARDLLRQFPDVLVSIQF